MTVIVRANYAIGDDGSLTVVDDPREVRPFSGGGYREDDHERIGGCVFPGDFGDFKPRAEVLVKGACHTPRGSLLRECPVMVKVGAWSKSLRVTGRQIWGSGNEPHGFVSMPLDWEHTYGGHAYPTNPVGRGFETDEMPTVMRGRDVLRRRGDAYAPASLSAVNPRWPQRSAKLGSEYGGDTRRMRAPFHALDFDWAYFQEAPEDQWLEGYLRGDEAVVFQNLHPRVPILTVKLPETRVRAFVRDDTATFREIPMVCDTLFADLDSARLELSWRGVVDVREDDLEDVRTMVIAEERLGAARAEVLPVSHFEAIAVAVEEDPLGRKALPSLTAVTEDAEAGTVPAVAPLLDGVLGKSQDDPMKDAAAAADTTFAPMLARPEVQKALAEREPVEQEAPIARSKKPGSLPYTGLRRQVRGIVERALDTRKKAIEGGATPSMLGPLMDVESIPLDPRWKEADPSYSPPEPLSSDEPGPKANLVDRDLRKMDLRGRDLRGANLEGAILTGVDLEGAKLQGARLYGATLYKARLEGADLEGADLTRVNAAFVDAAGARFVRATLEQACFDDADLSRASFEGARGEYPVFTRAKLGGAVFRDVSFLHPDLDDADLEGADFARAVLQIARVQGSRARRADFSGADVSRASFAGADLSEARFFDAKADGAIFTSTKADRAVFAFAKMRGCHMDKLSAKAADFHGADLRQARLYRARCEGARFTSSNLFGADLTKAALDAANLSKANLYEAKLLQCSMKDCDMSGANTIRCVMERA